MPIEKPSRRLVPIKAGGIWDESSTPVQVSGTGLTACLNLTYRRYGAWSKRSGSAPAFRAAGPTGRTDNGFSSGIRWYRAYPSALTQVVTSTFLGLYSGSVPNLVPPYAPMTQIATYNNGISLPVCFTSMRDPAESSVSNNPTSDVLIIAGASLAGQSFASGYLGFVGTPVTGMHIVVTFNGHISTAGYNVVASDTLASVAVALAAQINQAEAVTGVGGPSAFIASTTAVVTSTGVVTIPISALNAGVVGNGVTVTVAVTNLGGGTLAITAHAPDGSFGVLNGGGGVFTGPLKYDGNIVTPLSSAITQNFSGCVAWHNHCWFWGDPNHPDTVYASDIDNPEGFSFMSTYGGYDIGVGDGDPAVQACVPIGNSLYVFKRNSIYVITGYDFQAGEYQFAVQPVARGYGIPYRQCVAHLRNAIVFWSGSGFYRLANGAYDPEYIGGPIPYTSQKVSLGRQDLVRAVAGTYQINTAYGSELRTNIALWAVDVGNGNADTILVYDDDAATNIAASSLTTSYPWARWTGWPVIAWIPFTGGAGPNQTGFDIGDVPTLYFIPLTQNNYFTINQVGGSATSDVFTIDSTGLNVVVNPISFSITTGWMDFTTPVLAKQMHQIFLDVEVAIGATPPTFALTISSKIATGTLSLTSSATLGTEQYQDLHGRVNPSLRGKSYQITVAESATGTGYEINGLTYDFIEEALVT